MLISWRDLAPVQAWQLVALVVGVVSMSMTVIAALLVARDFPVEINQVADKGAD